MTTETIRVSDFQVTWEDGTTTIATITGKPTEAKAIKIIKVGAGLGRINTVKYLRTYKKEVQKQELPTYA